MSAHAKLSASGSARWIACPGSVQAEKGIADNQSPHALEGSCAHELAELVLKEGGSCFDWEGKQLIEFNDFTVPREMCEYVQEYVDYVKSLGGEQEYEQRVDFSRWVPEGFGTSDAIVLKGTTLHIADLKYGKGQRVDAEQNSQGMLYALGAYDELSAVHDIEQVTISIVQPRLDHVSEWSLSVSDLLAWGEWVSVRAEMTLEEAAERVPGDKQCVFCKAKAVCPALADYSKRIIMADFDSLDDLAPVNRLSDAQLRQALEGKKLIESWLSAVESLVEQRLMDGQTFEGFKLVAGRSLRMWQNEQDAETILTAKLNDEAYSKKLISPAQAEKLLGKARVGEIADLIVKPEGKPTLAPESDKRPAIGANLDDFSCIAENNQ